VSFTLVFALQLREKARKNLSQGKKNLSQVKKTLSYRADVLSFRLQSHSPGFVPRPVCAGLMVDKMAARLGFLHVFRFCPVTVIPSMVNSFVSLSPAVVDFAVLMYQDFAITLSLELVHYSVKL
jgi:hypothetical protein